MADNPNILGGDDLNIVSGKPIKDGEGASAAKNFTESFNDTRGTTQVPTPSNPAATTTKSASEPSPSTSSSTTTTTPSSSRSSETSTTTTTPSSSRSSERTTSAQPSNSNSGQSERSESGTTSDTRSGTYDGIRRTDGTVVGQDSGFTESSMKDFKPSGKRHIDGYNPKDGDSLPSTEKIDYHTHAPKQGEYSYDGYTRDALDDASIKAFNKSKRRHGKEVAQDFRDHYDRRLDEGSVTDGDNFSLDGTEKGHATAYKDAMSAARKAIRENKARTPEDVSKIISEVSGLDISADSMNSMWSDFDGTTADGAVGAGYAGSDGYVLGGFTTEPEFDISIIDRELDVNRHCKFLGVNGSSALAGSALPYTFSATNSALTNVVAGLLQMREGIFAATDGAESNVVKDLKQAQTALTDALEYFASGSGVQQIAEAMDQAVQDINMGVAAINTEGPGFKQEWEIATPIIAKLLAAGVKPTGVPPIAPNPAAEQVVTRALEAGVNGASNMDTVLEDAESVAKKVAGVLHESAAFNPEITGQTKTSAGDVNPTGQHAGVGGSAPAGGVAGGGGYVGGGGGGGGAMPRPVGGGGGAVGANRAGAAGGAAGGRSDEERRSAAEKLADLIAGKDGDEKKDDKLTEEERKKKAKERLDEMLEEAGLSPEDDEDSKEKDSKEKDSDDTESTKVADDVTDVADTNTGSGVTGGVSGGASGSTTIDPVTGQPVPATGAGTEQAPGVGANISSLDETQSTAPGGPGGVGNTEGTTGASTAVPSGGAGTSANPAAAEQDELSRRLADATHLSGGSATATGLRDQLATSGSGMGTGGVSTMREATAQPAGAAGGMAGGMAGVPGAAGAGAAGGAAGGAGAGAGAGAGSGRAGMTPQQQAQVQQAQQQAERERAEAERKAEAQRVAGEVADEMREMGAKSTADVAAMLSGDGPDTGLGGGINLPEGGWKAYGEYLPDPFGAEKGDIVATPQGDGVYDGEGTVDMADGRKLPINQVLTLQPPEYGIFRPESDPVSLAGNDADPDLSRTMAGTGGGFASGYAAAADPFSGDDAAGNAAAAGGGAPGGVPSAGGGLPGGMSGAPMGVTAGSTDPFAAAAPAAEPTQAAPAPEQPAPSQPQPAPAPAPAQPEPQQSQPTQQQFVASERPAPSSAPVYIDVHTGDTEEGRADAEPSRNNTGTGFASTNESSISSGGPSTGADDGESVDSTRQEDKSDDRGAGTPEGAATAAGSGSASVIDATPATAQNTAEQPEAPERDFVAADDRTKETQDRPKNQQNNSGIREVAYEGHALG